MITETEGADREGNGGSDYQVWADEWEYKRHECGPYVMFLMFGLVVWVVIAKQEHDDTIEEEYKIARSSAAHAAAVEMGSPVSFRMWREEQKAISARKENGIAERTAKGAD